MQGLIFCHSEPPELTQLCISRSFALLPFAGSTILSTLINRFLDSDISDIVITHQVAQTAQFEQYIISCSPLWPSKMHISLCPLPYDCSLSECLNRIRTHLTFDYVFITGSTTFLTDLDLRQLFLSLLRTRTLAVAAFSALSGTDSKMFASLSRELVLTTRSGTKVLGYFSVSDIKKHTTLPRALTAVGSSVLARNDLRDVGFYLLTRSALESITRLRDDLAHRKKSLWQLLTTLPSSEFSHPAALDSEDEAETSPYELCKPNGICLYEHKDKRISVKLSDPLMFSEATRVCLQKTAALGLEDTGKKVAQKDYSQLASDCTVGQKSMITGSLISSGCAVGAGCRIINSVLLSNVTVKDNCVLQGCVLGEHVTVESQCNLKNCAIASSQRVPDGTNLESEQLGFTDPELEVTQN